MNRIIYLLILQLFSVGLFAQINRLYIKPNGTGDGSSWGNALSGDSLQSAINKISTPGEIWIAAGDYIIESYITMREGVAIYGGFSGIETNLSQRDVSSYVSNLEGEIGLSPIIVNYNILDNSAVLDGVRVIGWNESTIYSNGGLFNNCTLINNFNNSSACSIILYSGSINNSKIICSYSYAISSLNSYFSNCDIIAQTQSISNSDNCIFENCKLKNYEKDQWNMVSSTSFLNCLIDGGIAGYGSSNNKLINSTLIGEFRNSSGEIHNSIVTGYIWYYSYLTDPIIKYSAIGLNKDFLSNDEVYTINGISYSQGNSTCIRFISTNYNFVQFVDPENGDYSLMGSSPCINAGNNNLTTVTTDILGNPRIFEGIVDMGAFENQESIISVTILGDNDEPVRGAQIIFNNVTYFADDNGIAHVGAFDGVNNYVVSDVWYSNSTSGNITINETSPKTLTVYLTGKKEFIRYFVKTNGTGDGTSWSNALPGDSLQYVLNICPKGGEIWVADGVYKPKSINSNRYSHFRINRSDISIIGGFVGNESSIDERKLFEHETILSGDIGVENVYTDNCFGVLTIGKRNNEQQGTPSIVDGLVVEGAYRNNNPMVLDSASSGISNYGGIVKNCVIRNNKFFDDSRPAGILSCYGATVENCIIINNEGTIYGTGVSASSDDIYKNCIIANNFGIRAAGIYVQGNATFINCNIVNNEGNSAVYIEEGGTFTNCIIWGNSENQIHITGSGSGFSHCAIEGGFNLSIGDNGGNINLNSYNDDLDGPNFINPSRDYGIISDAINADWRLSPISHCINSGISVSDSPAFDFERKPRVYGTSVDIGVFEMCEIPKTGNITSDKQIKNGEISVCPQTAVTLIAPSETNLIWSNGSTDKSLIADNEGVYTVFLSDINGCIARDSVKISNQTPYKEELGVLSYGKTENSSPTVIVAWERTANKRTEKYEILRETALLGTYAKIGEKLFNEESVFEDASADAKVKQFRYKLVTIDSVCKNRAESSPHRTILLQNGINGQNHANLNWTLYEGLDFKTYKIYRGTTLGTFVEVDQVTSDVTNWTDPDVNQVGWNYRVGMVLTDTVFTLNPVFKTSSGPFSLSISNIAEAEISSLGSIADDEIQIFPNPVIDIVTISSTNQTVLNVQLFDINGQFIKEGKGENAVTFDMKSLASGIYFVKVTGENSQEVRIVEKM